MRITFTLSTTFTYRVKVKIHINLQIPVILSSQGVKEFYSTFLGPTAS